MSDQSHTSFGNYVGPFFLWSRDSYQTSDFKLQPWLGGRVGLDASNDWFLAHDGQFLARGTQTLGLEGTCGERCVYWTLWGNCPAYTWLNKVSIYRKGWRFASKTLMVSLEVCQPEELSSLAQSGWSVRGTELFGLAYGEEFFQLGNMSFLAWWGFRSRFLSARPFSLDLVRRLLSLSLVSRVGQSDLIFGPWSMWA